MLLFWLIVLLSCINSVAAVLCSSFDQENCFGCTSSGECFWEEESCETLENSVNCGDIGITSVDDEEHHHADEEHEEPCQKDGAFPFYCSKELAIQVSPLDATTMLYGLYMPDDDSRIVMSSYAGPEAECTCEPLAEACKEKITDAGYNYPFYCDAISAEEISPTSGSHSPHGHSIMLFMPDNASPMIHDGSYDGDAPVCSCDESTTDDGNHNHHHADDYEDDDTIGGSSSDNSSSSSSKKSNKGNKAAVIAVGVIVVVLIGLGFLFFVKRSISADDDHPNKPKGKPLQTDEEDNEKGI
mmetsp:Transcript_13763/g.17169  ORF Transcript_13763/g.17169 Transcript_13763/m.17169 type:complete len:299 (+) Transcript_13763:76-972(+)